MERATTDEGVWTARDEDDANVVHLGERGARGLDLFDQSGRRSITAATSVARGPRRDVIAQKGKKNTGERRVESGDGRGVQDAIALPGRMDRGSDGADATGFELAALSGGGGEAVSEEKEVHAARGALGESGNGGAVGGAPAEVRGLVVPIGDDQAGGRTEEDGEIGVGSEEPLAGEGNVGDAGLVQAVARLEVLGAGLERQERDAKGEPPACAAEAGQAFGVG